MGAKFTPCMRTLPEYSTSSQFSGCWTDTESCSLEEMCGFGGFGGSAPNQSFRFVVPIFMHAGIVHYVMNMLCHLRLGADLECLLGAPRYILLYMAAGIWGFVLSAMFNQSTSGTSCYIYPIGMGRLIPRPLLCIASMGCSGALFGLIGYMFIDVIVNWKTIHRPMAELMKLLIMTIISLVLGLLPGLDNFCHLGKSAPHSPYVYLLIMP